MSRKPRALLLGGALLATSALTVHAQVQPAANVSSSASTEAARAEFRKAFFEVQNVGGPRADKHFQAALAADQRFGLARIYQTVVAPGMTAAEREARISESMGTLGSAKPAELLLAAYWRETAAGRGAAAVPIIKTAAELAPEDPEINYIYNNTQRAGKQPAEQVAMLKSFLQRFPNHAAAWNTLAYTSWRTGDREGTLAAAEKYMQVAPQHPNSHDTYADVLLLLGRGQEAIPHVEQIRRIDPDWTATEAKLGTIKLTMGDVKGARTHFDEVVRTATEPQERIEAAYWLAAVDLHAKNPKAAVQQITRIADVAKGADLPGAVVLAHSRAAVIQAYTGDRRGAQASLAAAQAAAMNDNQKATHQAHTAIVLSRLGQADDARAAATQFASLQPNNPGIPGIDAIQALDRKDYAAAEAAIAKTPQMDVLPRALRAELLLRTGKKAEGEALQKEVLSASAKQDGNPFVEFSALVGRLRLTSM
jgi:tetratricopeptide (TPR) repeat protein